MKVLKTTISGWKVTVEKLLPLAKKDSTGNYVPSHDTLSFPAAQVKAVSDNGGDGP